MMRPGLIVIWNEILPEARSDFLEWHSREHIPERVSIPGFLRGQRWFGEEASPQYLTVYDTRDAAVLTSEAYLQRLNNPTPWTRSAVAAFRNTARAAGERLWQSSESCGGMVLAARLDPEPQQITEVADRLMAGTLSSLARAPGIARVRLAASVRSASQIQTAERSVRSGDVREPAISLLVEGFDGREALQDAFNKAADAEPALGAAVTGIYALQFDLAAGSID
jgi:hypothetical protein